MADMTISPNHAADMTGSGLAGAVRSVRRRCARSLPVALPSAIGAPRPRRRAGRWCRRVVDRADLIASSRASKDGGTTWRLSYRVKYELNGEPQAASLTSRCSVFGCGCCHAARLGGGAQKGRLYRRQGRSHQEKSGGLCGARGFRCAGTNAYRFYIVSRYRLSPAPVCWRWRDFLARERARAAPLADGVSRRRARRRDRLRRDGPDAGGSCRLQRDPGRSV